MYHVDIHQNVQLIFIANERERERKREKKRIVGGASESIRCVVFVNNSYQLLHSLYEMPTRTQTST